MRNVGVKNSRKKIERARKEERDWPVRQKNKKGRQGPTAKGEKAKQKKRRKKTKEKK